MQSKQWFIIILGIAVCCCLLTVRKFESVTTRIDSWRWKLPAANCSGQQVAVTGLWGNLIDDQYGSPSSEKHSRISTRQNLNMSSRHRLPEGYPMSECVTEEELRLKFEACRRDAVKEDKDCEAVHANPDIYWRPQDRKKMQTHDIDFKRMCLASKCCAFDYSLLIGLNPRNPPFPWERDFLCGSSALIKMEDTAYASKSSVRLLPSLRGGSDFYVGDKIKLEVVLKNGKGVVQRRGGDSVRVWLVNNDLRASVVADVVDLKNGSYFATSILPWSGKVRVRATIAHTRDLLRAVAYIQRFFTTSHWFTALWKRGMYSEATPCSPYPALPAYKANEICNLTLVNGGSFWFCGKPFKKQLNCSDYISSKKIDFPSFHALTKAERELTLLTETGRPFIIPNDIHLDVQEAPNSSNTLPHPKLACNKRDLVETFQESQQSGYFFNNHWRPFSCSLPAKIDKEFLERCLQNTELIYIGDSNSRRQNDLMSDVIQCESKITVFKRKWREPKWCVIDKLNISVRYFPPVHPFYGTPGEYIRVNISEAERIDKIPSTGKYILHLHNFLHFASFHMGVLEQRLVQIRAAVSRLLARNAHVFVVYQSAHAAYARFPLNRQKQNHLIAELQRQIMQGLGPRVMFANTFPISVAKENNDRHPPFLEQFLYLYMGHICGREF